MKNPLLLFALVIISLSSSAQVQDPPGNDSSIVKLAENILGRSNVKYKEALDKLLKDQESEKKRAAQEFKKLLNGAGAKYKKPGEIKKSEKDDLSAMSMSAGSASPGSSSNSFGQLIAYPSPTAASITVHAQADVDTYGGRFNFSIPLYTLKSRRLEVPITIGYSSSGGRVDEYASWVGHQWSLNAGGAITRVMKSLPDEFLGKVGPNCSSCIDFNAFGYLNTGSKVNLSTLEASTNWSLKRKAIEFSNFQALDGLNHGSGFPEAWDTQPDEFYFNFGKYSGKFVFDQSGNIRTIPHQNLSIVKTVLNNATTGNIPKIVKFEVTTDDGTIYVFGDDSMTSVEETKLETLTMSNFYQYWTTQTVPDGNGLFGYFRLPELNVKVSGGSLVADIFTVPGNSQLNSYNFFTSSWYLKEIKTPGGDDKITFSYTNVGEISYIQNRSISLSMPTISEVELSNNGGWIFISPTFPVSNPGQAEKVFPMKQAFNYSVHELTVKSKRLNSISTDNGNQVGFSAITSRNDLQGDKRLDAINIFANGFLIKGFKFGYEDVTSPFTFDLFAIGGGLAMDADVAFIDRKFAILTANGQSLNATNFINKYNNIFVAESKRLFLKSITEVGFGGPELPPYQFYYDPEILPRKFSYKKDKWGFYSANSRGTTIPKVSYTGTTFGDFVARSNIRLIGWDAINSVDQSTLLEAYKGATLDPHAARTQAGILKKVVFPTGGSKEVLYALNHSSPGTSLWGTRVTEVKDLKDASDPNTFISTKYTYTDGTEVYPAAIYGYTLPALDFEGVRTYSSSQINPTYVTKGSIVGYRTAQVFKTGLGKTVYSYKNPTVEGNEFSNVYQVFSNTQTLLANENYPFPQHLDTDWRRGLLEKVEVYNNEATGLLSRTTNTFDTNPSEFANNYSFGMVAGTFNASGFPNHRAGFYKHQSGLAYLKSTLVETFDQADPGNDSKKISATTNYYFNKPQGTAIEKDLLVRKVEKILPNGEKEVTQFKYVNDYLDIDYSGSTDYAAKGLYRLKQNKIFNIPIETITHLETNDQGNYLRSGQLILFREFSAIGTAKNALPWVIKRLNPSNLSQGSITFSSVPFTSVVGGVMCGTTFDYDGSRYKSSFTYDSYDNYGNPTSVFDESGIPVTYLWDDKKTYVIYDTKNPGANQHQTIYQHEPLVGITQITDPNSRNTKFTYDNFKRLRTIKDHDNNILSRYRYHYKGQDEMFTASLTFGGNRIVDGSATISVTYKNTDHGQTSYQWDFGDGSSSTTSSSTAWHTYTASGNYRVTVTISNPDYGTASASQIIYIAPALVAGGFCFDGPESGDLCLFEGLSYGACTSSPNPQPYHSTEISVSASGGCGGYSYTWEYMNTSGNWQYFGNSSSATAPFQGTYSIRCIINDSCGNEVIAYTSLNLYYSQSNCAQR